MVRMVYVCQLGPLRTLSLHFSDRRWREPPYRIPELHSVCLDLELAGNPGRGLRFNRAAFLEHLERYRTAPGWFDSEGHRRFPFPEEVVANNRERPDYLARFNIEKF